MRPAGRDLSNDKDRNGAEEWSRRLMLRLVLVPSSNVPLQFDHSVVPERQTAFLTLHKKRRSPFVICVI